MNVMVAAFSVPEPQSFAAGWGTLVFRFAPGEGTWPQAGTS